MGTLSSGGPSNRRWRRRALSLLVTGLVVLPAVWAHAEIKVDDPEWIAVTDPCDFDLIDEGSLHQNGLALIGETIQIVGDLFKISYRYGPNCPKITVTDLPFDWTFQPPGGSAAVLQGGSPTDADPLNPYFVPDLVGDYEVALTYCRQTCIDEPIPGESIPLQYRSITIHVRDSIVVPPESEPELPPSARQPTPFFSGSGDGPCLTRDESVPGTSLELNAVFPQWVTTEHWDGADDYAWLEGAVVKAGVAGVDGEVNHITHDVDFAVDPDPTFQGVANHVTMGVEWETRSFPDAMRPLPGDRVSTYGFHIYDCDHDDDTEIHPPVVTAVQRPRPIAIPESLGFGSNVYVPGIITDIYANKTAGEITSNCSLSGLHQPGHYGALPFFPFYGPIPGACIENPHPLDRSGGFVFNIYLPPNPAKLMAEGGRSAAPAPLYCVVGDVPCEDVQPPGSPEPVVTVETETDPDTEEQFKYLQVTLDLSSLQSFDYSRRITAGWVYPAPDAVADNWGLSRYQVQIDSLTVHDSGDALEVDAGDWRFWVAINNTDQVWTQMFNGDVADGTEDFGGRPWATESSDSGRSLGSHLLLFPAENPPRFSRDLSRRVYVHSSGYDDEFWDDPLGVVADLRLPTSAVAQSPHSSLSSQGAYALNYQVFGLGSVGPEGLTDAGFALSEQFTLRPSETGLCTPVGSLCVLLPAFDKLSEPWHPADIRLSPGDPPLVWSEQKVFTPQRFEWHTELTMEELRANIDKVRELYPEWAEGFVAELREEFDLVHGTPLEGDYGRALPPLEIAIPPDLWLEHFGDLDPTPPNTPPAVAVQGGQCLSDTSASAVVQLKVTDTQSPSEELVVTATSSNQALIPDSRLALGGSGADRSLTFSAVPKQSGSATITITASDGVDSTTLDIGVQVGTARTDVLTGTGGSDVLFGLAGKNTLIGGDGNDLLCGGNAPDRLDGGAGNDVLQGGRGNDVLVGGDGDDSLFGQNGDDSLTGAGGADSFSGGPGLDTNTDFDSTEGDTKDGT